MSSLDVFLSVLALALSAGMEQCQMHLGAKKHSCTALVQGAHIKVVCK